MFQVRTKALNFFAVVIPLYRSGILQCPVDRLQEEKCNVLQNFYNVKTPHDPRLERLVPDFNRKQTKMLMGKRRRSGSDGRARPSRSERSSTGIFPKAGSEHATQLIFAGMPEKKSVPWEDISHRPRVRRAQPSSCPFQASWKAG